MSNQSIKDKIKEDLVKSMKSGEKDKVEIIRFAQSFIKQLEKDKNIELSESETVQVLKKVIKRNQESYDQFIFLSFSNCFMNDWAKRIISTLSFSPDFIDFTRSSCILSLVD